MMSAAKSRDSGSSVSTNSKGAEDSPSPLASTATNHPCDSFSRSPDLPVFRLPVSKLAVQERYNQNYEQLIEGFITTAKAPTKAHVVLQPKEILIAPQPYRGVIWWNFGAGRTEEEAQEAWTLG
jgi:hypothetical protein